MTTFFFYKAKLKDGTEVIHSFNVDKVIRAVTIDTGEVVVLLDDHHDRLTEVPVRNKRGDITGQRTQKLTHQSEIFLSKEEGELFFKQTGFVEQQLNKLSIPEGITQSPVQE